MLSKPDVSSMQISNMPYMESQSAAAAPEVIIELSSLVVVDSTSSLVVVSSGSKLVALAEPLQTANASH